MPLLILLLPLLVLHTTADTASHTAALQVKNAKAGLVAEKFGAFMGSILHSLPRSNPFKTLIQSKLNISLDNTPPNSLPYPVDFSNSGKAISTQQFQNAAVNYAAGVLLLMVVPIIFAVLSFFLFIAICLGMCCGCCNFHKKMGKKRLPRKPVLLGISSIFGCLFIIALVVGAGVNFQLSATLDGAVNVGNLAQAMGSDAVNLINTTLDNVQSVMNAAGKINRTIVDSIPNDQQCSSYILCVNSIFVLVRLVNETILGNLTSLRDNATQLLNISLLDEVQGTIEGFPNLTSIAQKLDVLNISVGNISSQIPGVRSEMANLNSTVSNARNFNFTRLIKDVDTLDNANTTLHQKDFSSDFARVEIARNSLPDLGLIASRLDNPSSTSQNQLKNDLLNLNYSLYQFPNLSATANSLDDLQETLSQLDNETLPSLKSQLSVLKANIQSINSTTIPKSINYIDSIFRDDILVIAQNIAPQITKAENSIYTARIIFPRISSMIQGVNASASTIRTAFLSNIRSGLVQFNSTVSNITCLFSILDSFRQLNTSIAEFPPAVNDFFNQYDRLARDFAKNLTNLQSSLINPAISSVDTVIQSLNNITQLHSLNNQLKSANDSFNTLPDLQKLQSAINDFLTLNLSDCIRTVSESIQNITASHSDIPVYSLNQTLSNVSPIIKNMSRDLPDQSQSLRNISNSVEDSKVKVGIVLGVIDSYSLTWPMPDQSAAADAVRQLEADISSAPNRTDFINQFDSARTEMNSSKSFKQIRSEISSSENEIKTRLSASELQNLNDSINSFEDSVNSLPNLSATANTLREAQTTLQNAKDSIRNNRKEFDGFYKSFNDSNLDQRINDFQEFNVDSNLQKSVIDILNRICDTRSTVANQINEYFGSAQGYINDGRTRVGSFWSNYSGTYHSYRDDYRKQAQTVVNPIAALVVVLALLPLILFIIITPAIIFQKRLLSQSVVFCYAILVPFYFVISVPFIGPATFLGDHCPILTDMALAQANLLIDQSLSNGSMNVDKSQVKNALKYYLTCTGSAVDPISFAFTLAGYNPSNLTTFEGYTVSMDINAVLNQINASYFFARVENFSFDFNGQSNRIVLTPSFKQQVVDMQEGIRKTCVTLANGIRSLISCDRVSTLYNGLQGVPCRYLLGVFGSTAFLFELLAFLMIFASFFGLYVASSINASKVVVKASESSRSGRSVTDDPKMATVKNVEVQVTQVQVRTIDQNSESKSDETEDGEAEKPPSYSGNKTADVGEAGSRSAKTTDVDRKVSAPPGESEESRSRY